MQNSLDRLFEGIAKALRDDVLPDLTDPYAKAQVIGAIELLGNLSSRVAWASEVDPEAMAELAALVAGGDDDPDLRAAMLAALDAELDRLRTAKYGSDS